MSVSREASATDPTKTTTLQREYARRLRGALSRINAAIRRGIVTRDIFRLNVDDPPVFRFPSDADKQDAFMRWLRQQEDQELLTVIDRNNNQYVRHSYSRGLDFANRELRKADIEIPPGMDNPFDLPHNQDTLQQLYTRNFEELEGITATMNQQISRELTDGFTAGLNPREIARNVTDRVDKIGKHRATVMARTEVIRAHSEATLNRYEQMGVGGVTVRAEFQTAGDQRVCPVCGDLEGRTREESLSIDEMRTGTFTFDPERAAQEAATHLAGDFPYQPPIHAQCRCVILPVVP